MKSKLQTGPVCALIAACLCTHAQLSFGGGEAPVDASGTTTIVAPNIFQLHNVETYFSPGDACINAVVREILRCEKVSACSQ